MPAPSFTNAIKSATALFERLMVIKTKETKLAVGVDIGSTSVKAVALGPRRGDGLRPVLGQGFVPLQSGQDTDPSDAIRQAISALRVPTNNVNLSVSGQWVIMRIVETPTLKPTELKRALPFEAQRYLPFNIQDVVLDGAILGPADENKSWVVIVACKKDLLERRIDWVRRAGVWVDVIDVDALAFANGFLAAHPECADGNPVTRALINVGAQLTNLVILRGDVPYLIRDVPWGGEKLIRHAADQMGVETEALKNELAAAQGSPSAEAMSALKLSGEALVNELQLSFDYFENRFNQAPSELVVTGGLSQSPVFLDVLKSHLTQPVNAWVPCDGLTGQFAVAYGLALRGNT